MHSEKRPSEAVSGIGGRIRELRGSKTQVDFSKQIGIPKNTLGRYERGEMIPGGDAIALICRKTGAEPNWLLLGSGGGGPKDGVQRSAWQQPGNVSGPETRGESGMNQILNALRAEIRDLHQDNQSLRKQLNNLAAKTGSPNTVSGADRLVSVIGLAECGIKGWEMRSSTGLHAVAPGDISSADGGFGVIAVGESMRPAGIEPGFLCLCSPEIEPQFGDVVYVERKDRYAAIKLCGGEVTEGGTVFLQLQGWLPPDPQDPGRSQKPYIDKIAKSAISRVVTVLYIKRRL
jgi:transcriptional regulator with XRE-family HTH domain